MKMRMLSSLLETIHAFAYLENVFSATTSATTTSAANATSATNAETAGNNPFVNLLQQILNQSTGGQAQSNISINSNGN